MSQQACDSVDPLALFQANTRLAFHFSHYFCPQLHAGMNREDLEQLALIGLWKACVAYDPERGALSTLASAKIHGQVTRYLRQRRYRPLPQVPEVCNPEGKVEDMLAEVEARPEVDWTAAEAVSQLLGCLDSRERQLVIWSFGLGGEPPMTGAEIARAMGVTTSWVNFMLRKALARLREEAARRGLHQ